MMPDREAEREFCEDMLCPRLFALDDCSAAACPKVWGVPRGAVQIYYLDARDEEHFVGAMSKERK